jgi:hypothetical protein
MNLNSLFISTTMAAYLLVCGATATASNCTPADLRKAEPIVEAAENNDLDAAEAALNRVGPSLTRACRNATAIQLSTLRASSCTLADLQKGAKYANALRSGNLVAARIELHRVGSSLTAECREATYTELQSHRQQQPIINQSPNPTSGARAPRVHQSGDDFHIPGVGSVTGSGVYLQGM